MQVVIPDTIEMRDLIELLGGFVTVALAGWGALLSTIIFYKDRPLVKVRVRQGLFFTQTSDNGRELLIGAIANTGRRSVTISSISLRLTGGESAVFVWNSVYLQGSNGLPVVLGENAQHEVHLLFDEVKRQLGKDAARVTHLTFGDTVGNVYTCRIRRHLRKAFRK